MADAPNSDTKPSRRIALNSQTYRDSTITRQQSPQRVETGWFDFTMKLKVILISDFLALRLLYRLEPLTTGMTILVKMVEVVEKSLKFNVATLERRCDTLTLMTTEFGHNIEKLRGSAASHNPVFAEADICAFTAQLDNKSGALFQTLRYGSEKTTTGFAADIDELMPVVEKIFYNSLLSLPDGDNKIANIYNLIYCLLFDIHDQTEDRERLLSALRDGSAYFGEYEAYCRELHPVESNAT
jgi:hypothetical protein